jgi:rhodanese-related sulfurtransferase
MHRDHAVRTVGAALAVHARALTIIAMLIGLMALCCVSSANAADARIQSRVDPFDVPAAKHHGLEQYVTAREAARYLAVHRDILLIDVRAPRDIAATGIAVPVVRNVPLYTEQPRNPATNAAAETIISPRFADDMRAVVRSQSGKRKDVREATVFLICVSGIQAAIAADELQRSGFTRVYTVVDGYDGDVAPDGRRTVNGWRNVGLPWTPLSRPSQRAKALRD